MSEMIEQTIKESPLFKHLTEEAVNALVEGASVEVYQTGQKIIAENSPVSHLYVVLMGRVRVSTIGPEGEVELKTLGPGAYFGEVSLLSGNNATATVEVRTGPAQIVGIKKDDVLRLVAEDDKVRRMLQGVTIARAKDTIGKVLK
ncbi:MAG: cyclic nucleotide-binding domain-containing protein [Bradymonadaceae bacterium]|nr:cyclic nucleotide-binding domain-containing protein [Lujinxingiaceae bacterium]